MKTRARANPAVEQPIGNPNNHTRIISIPKSKIELSRPVIILGFPDNGYVGSICINHIVEQLAMHQIASVESDYVMPAALFIGKKFRHPFRIYANDKGRVCAMICEVPILLRGASSLTNAIVDWTDNVKSTQVIVLGGITAGNFSPFLLHERKALLLQNIPAEKNDNGVSDGNLSQSKAPPHQKGITNMVVPDSAIVPGLPGSLLSSCATRGIPCSAIMVPSLGDVPDPEGAAIVLESLNEIIPEMAIDASTLRVEGEAIKKRLEEFVKMHQRQIAEYEQATSRPSAEGIYK
jgi:uncharacterized protein